MRSSPRPFARPDQGFALVLVLAFVALLIGVCLAFFSNAFLQSQISNTSATQVKVDLLAQGAVETTVADLEREIVAGSQPVTGTTTFADGTKLYLPLLPKDMVPELSGVTHGTATAPNGLENLLKISKNGTPFYPGDTVTRAVNSPTTSLSQNGRSISPARWNAPLLLTKANPGSTDDATPVTAFTAPDWILVSNDPTNPNPNAPGNTVTGRYAYAIYDEGGLLDVNVAGYPSSIQASNPKDIARKNALAFADLTQIPGLTSTQIDALVDWRNYATVRDSTSNYARYVVSNSTGFLQTGNTSLSGSQSDQMFASRQALIDFFNDKLGAKSNAALQSSLQYLTTFSRGLNQPSYIPAVQTDPAAPVVLTANKGGNSAYNGDKQINPSFPGTRVQTSFTRNDGTTANVGEPLVNKRFALRRLAWVTYKGPSADRTQSDPDIQALIDNGVPWSYLQQGTAQNIEKYFGLRWRGNRWEYSVHNGGNGVGKIMLVGRPAGTGANASTYVEDANREPDFFELLKAGITVGSLGKTSAISDQTATDVPVGYAQADIPVNAQYNFDSSVDYHIIQIGANILSEVNPTSYPIRIAFDDGGPRGMWEFQGVTDLPYLSYVFNGVLRTQASSPAANYSNTVGSSPLQYPAAISGTVAAPGNAFAIQVPAVWNPYDPNGTPGVLRPSNFRVLVDSNDPVSLANGGQNHLVWCAAMASPRSSGGGGDNFGLGAPWKPGTVSSFQATQSPTSTTGVTVSDAVTFNDNNGLLYREPTLIFRTTVGGASRTKGNISSIDDNPLPGAVDAHGTPFAPLVLGRFPLAFQFSNSNYNGTNTTANPVMFAGAAAIGPGGHTNENRVYFTYRLQYQDSAGNWVTYDTKYGRTTHGMFSFHTRANFSPCVIKGPDRFNTYSWAAAMDPRSARFGLVMDTVDYGRGGYYSAAAPPDNGNNGGKNGWVFNSSGAASVTEGITYPIRPDYFAGFYFANMDSNNIPPGGSTGGGLIPLSTKDIPFPSFQAGWTAPVMETNDHGTSHTLMFAPGLYAQNNPAAPFYLGRYNGADSPSGNPVGPSYYADPDGVVRRAAGAYVPTGSNTSASTPVGLPPACIQGFNGENASLLKTPASSTADFTQSQSRPLLLHRPFRSVAELGYVFRDLPWKNLDFFTPESGDAGLLDLFCVNETSDPNALVAGKVNLNTQQPNVLAAVVAGAYVDDPKITNTTVGSIEPTVAKSIATALVARTADTANYGPLQNLSELIGKWKSAKAISSASYHPSIVYAGVNLSLSGGYKDGRTSYTGFCGDEPPSSGTPENLTGAYASISDSALRTSMSQVSRFREAPVRALSAIGQTRVWNLMIDVIAQTGRFPQGASSADKFIVEGEQRYWVHLAVDRLTGRVIDKQIEVVKE